jgi:arsenate reductase-like glutaredoxin family protein
MTHIVVPKELAEQIPLVLQEIGHRCDQNPIDGPSLLVPNAVRLSYNQAVKELMKWHDVHFWSNSPVAFGTDNLTTEELIKILSDEPELYETLIRTHAETIANENDYPIEQVIHELTHEPSDTFKKIMMSLLEEFRLDNLL